LAELDGDWALDLNGKQVTGPLKSWEDLGTQSFAGPATYRKQVTATVAPAGKRVFLEIADVNDYAKVKLNGKELEGRAWQPYRWDVTNVVKAGANDLDVEVRTTASGRGFGGRQRRAAEAAEAAGGRARRERQEFRRAALAAAEAAAMRRHRFRGCWGRCGWWRDESGLTDGSVCPTLVHKGLVVVGQALSPANRRSFG
jgi:hypothetical protein